MEAHESHLMAASLTLNDTTNDTKQLFSSRSFHPPATSDLFRGLPAAHRPPALPRRLYYLLGIVRGHWDLKKRETAVDFADDELDQVNMGIAIITPVQDLQALLSEEELRQMRKRADKQYAAENKATLAFSGKSEVPNAITAAETKRLTVPEFRAELKKMGLSDSEIDATVQGIQSNETRRTR